MFKFHFEDAEPESTHSAPAESTPVLGSERLLPAQLYSIDHLRSRAPKVSYTMDRHGIPRRDLFDVRFQLMGEDNTGKEEQVLLDDTEDVRKSVYEGGLKVWEGANDLVEVLNSSPAVAAVSSVLELGCGAGVPTCYLLYQAILQKRPGRFVFADYNPAVLRLLTMPNVVLAWLRANDVEELTSASGEAELTRETIDRMLHDLEQRGIIIEFVSGAWSPEFSKIVRSQFDLVLASETIYSLDSLASFTDVLEHAIGTSGTALVAAKKVYFGVGGGIVEFTRVLDERSIEHTVVLEKGNVGRVVVKVK